MEKGYFSEEIDLEIMKLDNLKEKINDIKIKKTKEQIFKEKQLQNISKSLEEHFQKNIPENKREEIENFTKLLSKEIKEKISFKLDENQEAILKLKIARYLQNNKAEDLDINRCIRRNSKIPF